MTEDEITSRIAELEVQIGPLAEELSSLRKRLARIRAGKASASARKKLKADRDQRIERKLREGVSDLYKRPDGLVKRVAQEEGVSTRTVSKINARIKPKRTAMF